MNVTLVLVPGAVSPCCDAPVWRGTAPGVPRATVFCGECLKELKPR